MAAMARFLAACAFCGLVAWGGYEHLANRAPTPASAGYMAYYQVPSSVGGIPRAPTMQAPAQMPQGQASQVQPAQFQQPQVQELQVLPQTMPFMATPLGSPSYMGAMPGVVSSPVLSPQGPGPLAFLSIGAMLAVLGASYGIFRTRVQGSERQHDLEMGMLSSAAADAKRVSTVKMQTASVKDLRERVASVKNTKKITSAMKLVAAAKVRRAQEAVLKSRPFAEVLESILGGLLKRLGKEGIDTPLLTARSNVKKVMLVLMTGDRGLCGGYNTQAIKKAEDRIAQLQKDDIAFDMVCIGNKGNQYFKKRQNVVAHYAMGNAPTAEESTKIADFLLASYLDADVDRVELIYTNFVSMVASLPSIRTMLPLEPSGIEAEGDEIFRLTSAGGDFSFEKKAVEKAEPAQFPPDMIFEQEPEQLLRAILPLYFNGQVLRQRQECVASELAARMQAMQNATDNASELLGTITQQMNRKRQAEITQEISEIVAGANC